MKNQRKNLLIALMTAAFVGLVNTAHGAEVAGVRFSKSVVVEDRLLSARGTGLYRHLGFIKAYVGCLYVEAGMPTENVLSDTAKRLELEYFHSIKGEDFGKATRKIIARNVDANTFRRLEPQIDALNALYEDVQPGDRYAITYVPGIGTELSLNGKPKGVIRGAEFASALYGMWIGPTPMNRSFQQQLMGL